MNAIAKLEAWNSKHKSHGVEISGPCGYAASCWTVTLHRGAKKVVCDETTFISQKGVDDAWHEDDGNLYCCVVSGNDFDDWPGLEATILKALECAEKFWPPESYK